MASAAPPPLASTPVEDGYYMPAEWEPHTRCWLLWPERTDVWRENAGPARAAFAAVVKAILDGNEDVTVCASPGEPLETAKTLLDKRTTVACVASNDAWCRDIGPTFLLQHHRSHNANGCGGSGGGGGDGGSGDKSGDEDSGHSKEAASGGSTVVTASATTITRSSNSNSKSSIDSGKLLRGIQFGFKAWGGLYTNYSLDVCVPPSILSLADAPRYVAPLVLEAGSIHTDGDGTLLTTAQCLLHPSRNPSMSKETIEAYLNTYLGTERVLWLPEGLHGDETDGHVDNLACFAAPGHVLLAWTDDINSPNYSICRACEAVLLDEATRDARGRRIRVTRLGLPPECPVTPEEAAGLTHAPGSHPRPAGDVVAASYVNFYLANEAVIMPLFDAALEDKAARAVLAATFPGREVIGVPAREILLGGGGIHCITQQQPRVVS